ncbi:FliA/WhiG family RNA polymerase sigma factor [Kurthia sibirica]|uniref:RNA polymerase sigma factor n=1 Tax=Kurthia sibirica TaxID=202750 RepID=A0A2U3AQV4_9BACL|nr:FliA/WhiG family RNA polymerase sigma factor [Kurthia sibirica]PWI26921.1 FliA/WhiG family RNA polymerase sigma factor [Kurthia sibirica]GEK32537.1 RNA polymerase sigma-D factor [Kurthia sibirica]
MQSTSTEELKLWQDWSAHKDPRAGDLLMKKYKSLVSYHVQRISTGLPKSVSRDELMSLGMMGLFDALNKFDISRDLKFDTYASFRVRGAIIDGLRKEDWLPRSAREKTKKLEAKIEAMEQRLQRHVSAEEVAAELDIPINEVYQTMQEHLVSNVLSIDEQLQDFDDSEGRSFVIRDEVTKTPEQVAVQLELLQDLAVNIKKLNDKEQLVLSMFYTDELTLTEIGEVLGLSTSRISQIHSKSLFKLKNLLSEEMKNA